MNEAKQTQVQTEKVMDVSELKPIESIESVDLNQHHKKETVIEDTKIIKVNSNYTDCKTQWVLKVISEVVHTLEREGEDKIEFRASELFNLAQDKDGNLKGFPDSKDSNLSKFMNDLRIEHPKDLIGRKATIKTYDKEVDGNKKTYLKFLY